MEVGEHYRPVQGRHGGGVYRVVGASDEVTLLRVADADGRRVHPGTLRSVQRATLEADFEPAENPDAGVSPAETARNAAQGLYWSVRRFLP
ncbi:MAG: hypothetical protein ABEH88_00600 [Halobacteriales archaeon]